MQVPSLAISGSTPSYPSVPSDPSEALLWLVKLPDSEIIANLEAHINARESLHTSPLWFVVLGFLHWRLGNPESALEFYNLALPHAQGDASFQVMRGMAARRIPSCIHIAEEAYLTAIKLDPQRSDAHYNLANLYREENSLNAELSYLASLRLLPSQPMAWHNYGILLLHELRLTECLVALKLSIQLDPNVPAVWCNLGLLYFASLRISQARSALLKAISLDPDNYGYSADFVMDSFYSGNLIDKNSVDAVWDLGLISLAEGDYKKGFKYYEIRFLTKNFVCTEVPTSGPRLRCLSDFITLSASSLIVWSEQGLGDAIQFGRYLASLDSANIPFEFRCRKPLYELFRDWFDLGSKVIIETYVTDKYDMRPHCSLLSLPYLFNSDLSNIPSITPYIKQPCPPPSHLKIPSPPGGLAVGIVWAANPKNKAMYRHKSIKLELLMPILINLINLDLIDLHCFQFGSDNCQLDPWRQQERVFDWSLTVSNFSDTAYLVNQLDLVITVDTAMAHLSGALGRHTWLLLPRNSDFRWLIDKFNSPWYPKDFKLFRQLTHGDWFSVVNQLKNEFNELFLLDLESLVKSKQLRQCQK